MKTEIDEARLILAGLAMNGFLSSPQAYNDDEIARESVKMADKLLDELERTQK